MRLIGMKLRKKGTKKVSHHKVADGPVILHVGKGLMTKCYAGTPFPLPYELEDKAANDHGACAEVVEPLCPVRVSAMEHCGPEPRVQTYLLNIYMSKVVQIKAGLGYDT